MGVLDELRKEAEAAAAEKEQETTQRQQALAQARAQLEPRMRELYKYFNEFKHHLEALGKEVQATYEIKDIGLVEELQQGQYGVSTDNPECIENFTFRCVCAKPGALQVHQRDAATVAVYRDYLRDSGLQAKVRDAGGGSAVFMVQPAIPVSVRFTADYERMAIRLRIRNLSTVGVSRHTLTMAKVNDKLLDELAKAFLRRPNRFDELVGATISNTGKLRLKKQVQAAMRKQQLEDERTLREKERTITGYVTRTLFRRKDD